MFEISTVWNIEKLRMKVFFFERNGICERPLKELLTTLNTCKDKSKASSENEPILIKHVRRNQHIKLKENCFDCSIPGFIGNTWFRDILLGCINTRNVYDQRYFWVDMQENKPVRAIEYLLQNCTSNDIKIMCGWYVYLRWLEKASYPGMFLSVNENCIILVFHTAQPIYYNPLHMFNQYKRSVLGPTN